MQPEISRRCKECGAAIRVSASFCPQCGEPLGPATTASVEPAATEMAGQPVRHAAQDNEEARVNARVEEPPPVPAEEVDDDGARARLQRARAAAREAVGEKIAPRVEKIRHASNVVLDEASDDPSLRFVLIAAALFIVALLLLLLSHVLG